MSGYGGGASVGNLIGGNANNGGYLASAIQQAAANPDTVATDLQSIYKLAQGMGGTAGGLAGANPAATNPANAARAGFGAPLAQGSPYGASLLDQLIQQHLATVRAGVAERAPSLLQG